MEKAPKAQSLYRCGRVLDDHSPIVEEDLLKSVKKEPSLVEAWNELGECYWKRSDKKALSTFGSALVS